MSYKNLEIWKIARELTIEIHEMTLKLPDFERYEEASQIRRSIKTVRSTIVEGYGRRQYKNDYIKFMTYALSSNDETIDHLEILFETKSLKDKELYKKLHTKLDTLGKKINNFYKALHQQHGKPNYLNESEEDYAPINSLQIEKKTKSQAKNQESSSQNLESNNQNPESRWKTLSIKEVYENPWIKLDEHQVINPSGGNGIYGKVHFKNKAIGIIPLDENNNTWIVGQHRYTLDQWSWEIPEGGGPLNIDTLESAKRELKEETGIIATHWTEIATTYLSNSVSDEIGYVFLAEDLKEGKSNLEETEADLIVKKFPFEKVLQMVEDGEITDSLSVIGILKLARIKGF